MAACNRILLCISAFLYYSGLLHIIHWLHRHSGPRLLILNYHQASGGELHRHLLYLSKHFRMQFVDSALEELYNEKAHSGKDRRLPLAVTFDDGYLDNYTEAYVLARKLQIPITIFLISGYIGSDSAFWWFERLIEKSRAGQVTLDGQTYDLKKPDDQRVLAQIIDAQVRVNADKEARQTYLNEVSRVLSVPDAARADLNETPVQLFTWEQAQEMQASGWVTFGGHTLHHPVLALLTNADEACKEVATCRSQLQEKLERPVRVFAYPHGGIDHIGVNGMLAVQHAGYRWALTTLQGANTPQTPPYLLRRISANSQLHWLVIAFITSGVWDFLSYCNWLIKRIKYRKALKVMYRFSN